MEKFKTITDFSGTGVVPMLAAIVTAVPIFFPVILFVFWVLGSGASYYIILKTTGKKRFFHTMTAMSFIFFIASVVIAAMNTDTTIFLSGYWVGFYILMVIIFYSLLEYYK